METGRRTSRTINSFITRKTEQTRHTTSVMMESAGKQELQTNALLDLHGGLQQV